MHGETSINGLGCSGASGAWSTKKGTCHTSTHWTPPATHGCLNQIQVTNACLQSGCGICTQLPKLSHTGFIFFPTTALCSGMLSGTAILIHKTVAVQTVFICISTMMEQAIRAGVYLSTWIPCVNNLLKTHLFRQQFLYKHTKPPLIFHFVLRPDLLVLSFKYIQIDLFMLGFPTALKLECYSSLGKKTYAKWLNVC